MGNYLNQTETFTVIMDFLMFLAGVFGIINVIDYRFISQNPELLPNITITAFIIAACAYGRQIK